jgi:tRNA (cmo5U34)-methyltransferase
MDKERAEPLKSEQIKQNFNDLANTYSDATRRKLIPCYDDFYRTGVLSLAHTGAAPRALDVGAGSGLYAAHLLARYPNASLTLIDFSEEMLALARKRFEGRPNTTFVLGNYATYDFTETYDIVISALSIHHLNAAEKAAFYRRVYELLTPGGEFLNADEIISPVPRLQERYLSLWFDFVAAQGVDAAGIERMRQSTQLDDPSTVSEQLQWLNDAGFRASDCVYRYRNFAVFYAEK